MVRLYHIQAPVNPILRYSPADQRTSPQTVEIDLAKPQQFFRGREKFRALFDTVTNDIYRPPRMGAVFTGVYPDEYFDPFHSPHRVRQLIYSMNEHLKNQKTNLAISVKKGDFIVCINSMQQLGISKKIKMNFHSKLPMRYLSLKSHLKGLHITSRRAAEVLGLSKSTCSRLLSRWQKQKIVYKVGSGKNVYYLFKK